MKYFTYVVRCNDDSLYTGYTKDLINRINVHNAGMGAKYTRARLPVRLIYFEEFDSITKAMWRELEIKKMTRKQKLNLIKMKNISWTKFMDMHSGGNLKEKQGYIYIQAPEKEARIIFYNRFGHNPERVTCTCCGADYSISERETLEEATAYERHCKWESEKYIEGTKTGDKK